MPSAVLPINPPAARLGAENAVLAGAARGRYHVSEFEGSLSIKTVVRGCGVWEAGRRRFQVHPGSYLVLNDRQRYTLTIDAPHRQARTFCVFFERGFVEDVLRATVTSSAALLDAPRPAAPGPAHFLEKLETQDNRLAALLADFQSRIATAPPMTRLEWDAGFARLAEALVGEHQDTAAAIARIPALRPSTRAELYRRVLRGRDLLLSSLDRPVAIREAAAAACLSPYHFHRAFRSIFGLPPHRFLLAQKLEHAARLLAGENHSVTEACYEAGFESLPSFSAAFRKRFGAAPRAFRRRN